MRQKATFTDGGAQFQSQIFKELYRLLKINQVKTSPFYPQINDHWANEVNGEVRSSLYFFSKGRITMFT